MTVENQTFYEILKVSENATLKEIKVAYMQRAREYHPDANTSLDPELCHIMMCKINEAYRVLRDPKLRKCYDETLFGESGSFVHRETANSSQKSPSNETKTKKAYRPSEEQYNYYNTFDFDEGMQKEFIDWIEFFSCGYMKSAYNYYKTINRDNISVIETLYNYFDDIINYEKLELKKEKKLYNL